MVLARSSQDCAHRQVSLAARATSLKRPDSLLDEAKGEATSGTERRQQLCEHVVEALVRVESWWTTRWQMPDAEGTHVAVLQER